MRESRTAKVEKTNGKGEIILVSDPDAYNDEGELIKRRKKTTNFTPKKKRRK